MRRWHAVGAAVSVLIGGLATSALAQSPAGMKLYAFSSGALTIGKGVCRTSAPMDPPIKDSGRLLRDPAPGGQRALRHRQQRQDHPDPSYWGPHFDALKPVNTPDVAIDAQLQKIGLSPDDIKYVVASHMHLDHGGNVAKFPNSTIVLQKDEIEYAMWPDEPFTGPFIPGDAAVLRAPVGSNQPNAFDMLVLETRTWTCSATAASSSRARVGHTPGQSDDGRAPAQHGYARPDR